MINKISRRIMGLVIIAIGVAIPTSTTINSILIVSTIPLWLLSSDFRKTFYAIRNNKYIWSIFILIGLYFIGMFYGDTDIRKAGDEFFAVASLLLIPIMIPFFADKEKRKQALNLFLITIIVLLLFSYLIWLGVWPEKTIFNGTRQEPLLFMSRITHGLLVAFAAFVFAVRARQVESRKIRFLYILVILFCVFNITVMIGGKTGYLILIVLTGYYFFSWWKWKGIVFAVLAIAVFGMFTYSNPQSGMHERIKEFYMDISDKGAWDWSNQSYKPTSTDYRIKFYKNTLKIIMAHPVIGVGTGGYTNAYSEVVKGTGLPVTDNPHTHYLRVASELGILGLCAFLAIFVMQWLSASQLHSNHDKLIARGLVLTIMSASLVSSALYGHLTRTFYIWMSALLFGGYKTSLKEKYYNENINYNNNKK